MKVIKRDGTTVDFDVAKIVVAIQKANAAVEPNFVLRRIKSRKLRIAWPICNRMRLLRRHSGYGRA